jgi:uncharacterized membrane protein YqiK
MSQNMLTILFAAGLIVVAMIVCGMILARLYKRATKEVSFVRTGFRGQKVIMNGGALVFPVLHEAIPVNMNTLRLEVRRANEQALITRDRMRVDVTAEFYVRVKPTQDAIANAAQTLGLKTMNPSELKELVEGKFVDALRAVAAEMAMEELHEQRVDFVQKVQQVVSEDLLKNGLELESVSLTGLDQTSKEHFNPDNAFDAEGLTKLTEAIEARRKKRNEIEQDTEVAVADKNLEAERKKLEIARDQEYARLEQQREVEIRRAAQSAEIAKEQAEKKRAANEAQIHAKQQVDTATIMAEKAVEEERIEKDRFLKEKNILGDKAIETAEIDRKKAVDTASILSEQSVEEERIEKDRKLKEKEILKTKAIETTEIDRKKTIELAEQDRAIAIAEKSKAQSEARAEADRAKAVAVKEEEAVITVRETEKAERAKAVELVQARQIAEQEAIGLKVAAETEKMAADDKAEAIKTIADVEAAKVRIDAQAKAEAELLSVDVAQKRYAVDAEGKRKINEAQNTLAKEQIAMEIRMTLIKNLPAIIRESVRPMERIDGIKIFQVEGLGGQGKNGDKALSTSQGNLADDVVNSALRYRSQAPLIDSLLADIGLDGGDINGLTQSFFTSSPPVDKPESDQNHSKKGKN